MAGFSDVFLKWNKKMSFMMQLKWLEMMKTLSHLLVRE